MDEKFHPTRADYSFLLRDNIDLHRFIRFLMQEFREVTGDYPNLKNLENLKEERLESKKVFSDLGFKVVEGGKKGGKTHGQN